MSQAPRNFTSLALALLLSACGGGGGGTSNTPTSPPPSNVVTVDLNDFSFGPRQLQIQPGTTVRFVHQGTDPEHTSTAKEGRWDSGFAFRNTGNAFEVTFSQADDGKTFEYFCETHQETFDMKGSIKVGNNAPDPAPGY